MKHVAITIFEVVYHNRNGMQYDYTLNMHSADRQVHSFPIPTDAARKMIMELNLTASRQVLPEGNKLEMTTFS